MMKQFQHLTFRKRIFLYILCWILLIGCKRDVSEIENIKYDIQIFQKSDSEIFIEYPQLKGEEYSIVNEIVYNEALSIMKYYGTTFPIKLSIKVVSVYQNDRYFNIVYEGTGQLDEKSRVNRYKYSTTLDVVRKKKLRLSDMVTVDDNFINAFMENSKIQLLPELYGYLESIDSDALYEYFASADQLDLEIDQQKDVFSYISEDGLNIVFPFPAIAGDYDTVTISGTITENGKFQID